MSSPLQIHIILFLFISLVIANYPYMTHRLALNSITPKTQDWICKIQVIDKFLSRYTKDKAKKYQLLLLQVEKVTSTLLTSLFHHDSLLFQLFVMFKCILFLQKDKTSFNKFLLSLYNSLHYYLHTTC